MPKDEPSPGIGHRYDWEDVVVWLTDNSTSASIVGVSASQHSGAVTTKSPNLSGDGPTIEYQSVWPLDHALYFTTTVGGQQPLIAWESLTDAARSTLNTFDFGSGDCSFNDKNFQGKLASAAL